MVHKGTAHGKETVLDSLHMCIYVYILILNFIVRTFWDSEDILAGPLILRKPERAV